MPIWLLHIMSEVMPSLEVLSIYEQQKGEGLLTARWCKLAGWLTTTGSHGELTTAHNNHLTSVFLTTSTLVFICIVIINTSRKSRLKMVGCLALVALQGMHDVERSNRRASSRSRWRMI